MPLSRGILETIYVGGAAGADANAMRNYLARLYADEQFMHVLPRGGSPPQTRHVCGSIDCV
jgi:N-acetyl-gamma-glutamylphosphate reductase